MLVPLGYWLRSLSTNDILVFVFGTTGVFAFASLFLMPYYWFKEKRQIKTNLKAIQEALATTIINTYVIHAKQIALAAEYEDEGDLFIVEYDTDKILYLWDTTYDTQEIISLHFELYEYPFSLLIGRQLYPLTEPVKPLIIDPKSKWNSFKIKGSTPAHMETEIAGFDAVVKSYTRNA